MPSHVVTCPSCGFANHPSCSFCIRCGADLPAAELVADPLAPEGAVAEADPAASNADRVRAVLDELGHPVREITRGWRVKVPVGEDRAQRVYVQFAGRDADGDDLIAFYTVCGPIDEQRALELLRCNAKLAFGAFSLRTIQQREYIVLGANQLATTADAQELRKLLQHIARTGDSMEVHLGGADEDLF
ncbi:MAG: hypothetical protein ACOCZK_06960 [Planctomycetota bacterium]